MPCRHDSSTFPAFSPNFKPDTLHLHQALAEYNYARVAAGLPTQNFADLSRAETHDVLERAQEIKDEKWCDLARSNGLLAERRPIPIAIHAVAERNANSSASSYQPAPHASGSFGMTGLGLLIISFLGVLALLGSFFHQTFSLVQSLWKIL